MKALQATRQWFDGIPTPVKIIVYSGLSLLVAKATLDLEALNGWYAPYLAIIAGVATNLIAWKILSLKEA